MTYKLENEPRPISLSRVHSLHVSIQLRDRQVTHNSSPMSTLQSLVVCRIHEGHTLMVGRCSPFLEAGLLATGDRGRVHSVRVS